MKSVIDRLAGDQVAIICSYFAIIVNINLAICINAQVLAGIDIDAISVHGNARTSYSRNLFVTHIDAVPSFIGYAGNPVIQLSHCSGIVVLDPIFQVRDGGATFTGQSDLCIVDNGLTIFRFGIILHRPAIHIGKCIRIGLYLSIQIQQILASRIVCRHII